VVVLWGFLFILSEGVGDDTYDTRLENRCAVLELSWSRIDLCIRFGAMVFDLLCSSTCTGFDTTP